MKSFVPLNAASQSAVQYTFDVFDTAVCRLVHAPDHVHFTVARKLRRIGVIALSDREWWYCRVAAEFAQRQTVPHREVTLPEIYRKLAGNLDLTPGATHAAMEMELAEELRLIRPIAPIRQFISTLDAAPCRPLFISDTYFSSKQVAVLLGGAGYGDSRQVVASCEHDNSKSAGSLFEHVARERSAPGTSFRHIGDNTASDVTSARLNGWNATLFADSHWTSRERVLFASGQRDFLSSAIAGCARAARLGQEDDVHEGIATAASTVVGPLFAAFVLWVLRDVISRGGRTIHFLARDGQVMVSLCRRLADWLGVDVDARYTLASRRAFLLPALPDDDDERMVDEALALSYYDGVSLIDALTCLKYSTEQIADVIQRSGVDPGTPRSAATEADVLMVRQAMKRKQLLSALRTRVTTERAATLAYLESDKMFESAEANIVDLGWRGTTQLRLQKVVGDRVNLVGHYVGLTNTVLDESAATHIWTTTTKIKPALLEVMASADHTSVSGFGIDERGVAVTVPPLAEDHILVEWGTRQQQQIAIRFVEYLTSAIELDMYSIEEVATALEGAAFAAYRHFTLSPTPAEAAVYGGILHSSDAIHARHVELARAITSTDMIRHVLDRASKGAVTSWYMGSIGRSQASLLPRLVHRTIDRTFLLQARLQSGLRRRGASRSARFSLRSRVDL